MGSRGPLTPIECKHCKKVLRDEHTLKCHIKAVHGPKEFPCPQCSKSFSSVGILMLIQKCTQKKGCSHVRYVAKNTKIQAILNAIKIRTMETSRMSVKYVEKSIYKPLT